jgi:hypothetical protein
MGTILLIAMGALLGLVGVAVSQELSRAAKARARLVPVPIVVRREQQRTSRF